MTTAPARAVLPDKTQIRANRIRLPGRHVATAVAVMGGLALVASSGVTLPLRAAGGDQLAAACGNVQTVVRYYSEIGIDPVAVSGDLAAAYEIELGPTVFSPTTSKAVPWTQVAAWVALHPPSGPGRTDVQQGYSLTELSVRGGYAYLQFSPEHRLTKLYLSATRLQWD